MHPWFDTVRPSIAGELKRLLADRGRDLARIGRWGPDATRRLAVFSVRGKMVRGGLAVLAWQMYDGAVAARGGVLRVAACLELLHSALLTHDDIMDDDRLRRGGPTLFAQYEAEAARRGARQPSRLGTSLGICAGDIAFFLALEALADPGSIEPARALELARMASRELAAVCAGQMQDVALGAVRGWPSRSEVLAISTYKTARYTFSLPLAAGALLAGRSPAARERLERLGELLGTVYQLMDDDLGVFGEEAETGKPVGADIREGKKTLLATELLRRARGGERRTLERLFGRPRIGSREVAQVREAAERLGARQAVLDFASRLAREAQELIPSLGVPEPYRAILRDLCASSLGRTR